MSFPFGAFTRLLINIKRTVYLLWPTAVSRNIWFKVLIIYQPSLLSSGCTQGPDMCTHLRSIRFTTGTAGSVGRLSGVVWFLSHWADAGRWSASARFWFNRGCWAGHVLLTCFLWDDRPCRSSKTRNRFNVLQSCSAFAEFSTEETGIL